MPSRKRIRKQNINPNFVYQALENSNETNDVMQESLLTIPKRNMFSYNSTSCEGVNVIPHTANDRQKGIEIFWR